MSKFIGADRHVLEVIKSGFHYGQLVRGEPRVKPTTDDSPGLTVTSSTRKMFRRIIPSVLAVAAHHAERECGRNARQSSVCGDIRSTLTYHASTDDVDESRGCTLRSSVRCKVVT